MRILITGGSGFIAGRLAFYLNKKGYDVTIGSRNDLNQFNLNSKVKVVKTNWNDKHSIAECCKNKDIIIHAAGMNSQLCEKYPNESINFKKSSTSLLINSLDPEFDKFIYISSAHVYANPLSGIISEDTKTKNIHPYAKSHLAAEKIVNEANNQKKINGLILRLSNCFGYPINVENDCWMLLVNDLCKQAITKKKLILNSGGEQQRDFISLHDFTRITCKIIEKKIDRLNLPFINVGSQSSMTVIEMAKLIQERCNLIYKYSPEIIRNEKKTKHVDKFEFINNNLRNLGIKNKNSNIREIDKLLEFCSQSFCVK